MFNFSVEPILHSCNRQTKSNNDRFIALTFVMMEWRRRRRSSSLLFNQDENISIIIILDTRKRREKENCHSRRRRFPLVVDEFNLSVEKRFSPPRCFSTIDRISSFLFSSHSLGHRLVALQCISFLFFSSSTVMVERGETFQRSLTRGEDHRMDSFPLHSTTEFVRKKIPARASPIVYKQDIAVRYLCPPTPPLPPPIIIREIRPAPPAPLPPSIPPLSP